MWAVAALVCASPARMRSGSPKPMRGWTTSRPAAVDAATKPPKSGAWAVEHRHLPAGAGGEERAQGVQVLAEHGVAAGLGQPCHVRFLSVPGDAELAPEHHGQAGQGRFGAQQTDGGESVAVAVPVDTAEHHRVGRVAQTAGEQQLGGGAGPEPDDLVALFLEEETEVHEIPCVGIRCGSAQEYLHVSRINFQGFRKGKYDRQQGPALSPPESRGIRAGGNGKAPCPASDAGHGAGGGGWVRRTGRRGRAGGCRSSWR
ncbi:hypothetical protein STANM309S_02545 [Streptomyces tanashiensis]